MFNCPRFTVHRIRLEAAADRPQLPENIVNLESVEAWEEVGKGLGAIYDSHMAGPAIVFEAFPPSTDERKTDRQ